MKLIIYEIAGWYGAFAVLLSYGLVSYGVISGESVLYQVFNITGALGLLTIAFAKKVYQSIIINIIWALIGIFALLKLFF